MNNSNITNKNLTIKVRESKLFDSLLSFQTFAVDNWEDIESYIKQHPKYKDYGKSMENSNKTTDKTIDKPKTERKTKKNKIKDENYIYYHKLEKSEFLKLGFPMKYQYLEFCSKHKAQIYSIHDKETLIETIKKLMLIPSETTDNLSLNQC